MRVGIANGRVVLVEDDGIFFARNADEFVPTLGLASLLATLPSLQRGETVDTEIVWDIPFPSPCQIFAVGLNYRKHAHEMGLQIPTTPMIFTKFPSALGRPCATVTLPGATTDWEAELVVVIGRSIRNVTPSAALGYVAGYMVGQDYSERAVQMANNPAQFSLGKSFENFAIAGPYLTTADAVSNPQDLEIRCDVNGQVMQRESTGDMAYSVAEIVSHISSVCELRAGDLIYTGSPAGVGQGQIPPRFLSPGDRVTTEISGLGSITNTFLGSGND